MQLTCVGPQLLAALARDPHGVAAFVGDAPRERLDRGIALQQRGLATEPRSDHRPLGVPDERHERLAHDVAAEHEQVDFIDARGGEELAKARL